MRKIQSSSYKETWRVYMFFPRNLYFKLRQEAPKEGYTKKELDQDHHVKDYIISILECEKT